MKIEVAESLFLSWLRHVRGCRIAQLNWKPSKTWQASNLENIEELYKASKGYFFQELNLDLYKKNSSVSQLVQQAEIDAIGICSSDGNPSIIAVDVAFHESGLNYGSRQETVARVVKKVLRTLFALKSYFDEYSYEIIFAAPKIHNAVLADLNEVLLAVDHFFENHGVKADCKVVSNADFFSEIVEPVSQAASQVADTSELFMRSLQLIQMASAAKPQTNQAPKTTPSQVIVEDAVNAGAKIGQLVQEKFRELLETKRLSQEEIERLCSKEYSKRIFGISFPVLIRSNNTDAGNDSKGRARYYKYVIANEFLLCSQWLKQHHKPFESWHSRITESEKMS